MESKSSKVAHPRVKRGRAIVGSLWWKGWCLLPKQNGHPPEPYHGSGGRGKAYHGGGGGAVVKVVVVLVVVVVVVVVVEVDVVVVL